MSHKVHAGEFDSFYRLGSICGRKYADKVVTHGKKGVLKELTKSYVPSEEFCTDALVEYSSYHKLPFEKQQKARAWFLEGWLKSLTSAYESYKTKMAKCDDIANDESKELRFMKVSDGQFAFSMVDVSSQLAVAGVKHMLVLAAKPDTLAELLCMNKEDADGECGDADSDFGYFVLFVFKKGQFDKFLAKNQKDIKSRGLSTKGLDEAIRKAEREASTDDMTVILKIDSDDDVIGVDYYSRIEGLAAWQRIEEAYEDFEYDENDEAFDPETDEIEDD